MARGVCRWTASRRTSANTHAGFLRDGRAPWALQPATSNCTFVFLRHCHTIRLGFNWPGRNHQGTSRFPTKSRRRRGRQQKASRMTVRRHCMCNGSKAPAKAPGSGLAFCLTHQTQVNIHGKNRALALIHQAQAAINFITRSPAPRHRSRYAPQDGRGQPVVAHCGRQCPGGVGRCAALGRANTLRAKLALNANSAETFQPYDPSKITGSMDPTLPMPAQRGQVRGMGKIIIRAFCFELPLWGGVGRKLLLVIALGPSWNQAPTGSARTVGVDPPELPQAACQVKAEGGFMQCFDKLRWRGGRPGFHNRKSEPQTEQTLRA